MAAVVTLPKTDPALRSFAQNMSSKISAAPTTYGCTTSDATSLATAYDDFASALDGCDPAVRSHPVVIDKNNKRTTLKNLIRQIALKVQATPTVSDTQKAELGLTIPAQPSPVPAPAYPPAVDIVSVVGRTVELKIHDSQESRRGKPAYVAGAVVYSFIGESAPSDPNAWISEGITSKTKFQIVFSPSVPAGAQVWFTAQWYNGKAQTGPGATAVSTYLQGGSVAAG